MGSGSHGLLLARSRGERAFARHDGGEFQRLMSLRRLAFRGHQDGGLHAGDRPRSVRHAYARHLRIVTLPQPSCRPTVMIALTWPREKDTPGVPPSRVPFAK